MKSSFCIDLQRFMLIPTKFPLIHVYRQDYQNPFVYSHATIDFVKKILVVYFSYNILLAHPIYLGGNFLILQKIYTFVP